MTSDFYASCRDVYRPHNCHGSLSFLRAVVSGTETRDCLPDGLLQASWPWVAVLQVSVASVPGTPELDISRDALVLDETDVQYCTFNSPQAENMKVKAEFGYSDTLVTV